MNFHNDPFLRFLQEEGAKNCMEQRGAPLEPMPMRVPVMPREQGACPWPRMGDACTGDALAGKSLAMVYSPCQTFEELYEPCEGLRRGTIFVQLDKPFLGDRCQ